MYCKGDSKSILKGEISIIRNKRKRGRRMVKGIKLRPTIDKGLTIVGRITKENNDIGLRLCVNNDLGEIQLVNFFYKTSDDLLLSKQEVQDHLSNLTEITLCRRYSGVDVSKHENLVKKVFMDVSDNSVIRGILEKKLTEPYIELDTLLKNTYSNNGVITFTGLVRDSVKGLNYYHFVLHEQDTMHAVRVLADGLNLLDEDTMELENILPFTYDTPSAVGKNRISLYERSVGVTYTYTRSLKTDKQRAKYFEAIATTLKCEERKHVNSSIAKASHLLTTKLESNNIVDTIYLKSKKPQDDISFAEKLHKQALQAIMKVVNSLNSNQSKSIK